MRVISLFYLIFFEYFQPFCIFLDLITVTIPINPKKEKPNKLQLLIHSNWAMIIRSASATCMIIALISIRLIALGHHLPRFTSEENPVAAHPDFLTRVCFSRNPFVPTISRKIPFLTKTIFLLWSAKEFQ